MNDIVNGIDCNQKVPTKEHNIIIDISGKTLTGGDNVKHSDIKIGGVVYQVERVFIGNRTVSEILTDVVSDHIQDESGFDLPNRAAV